MLSPVDRVCPSHPVIEARLRRLEVLAYVILGATVGTGVLQFV